MKPSDLKDERLESKIKVSEEKFYNGTPCWEWAGILDVGGYPRYSFWIDGKKGGSVHRYSYERFTGRIPDDYQIHHLCGNRACVNPLHLKAMTPREITLLGNAPAAQNVRKTHCINGHPLEGDNLLPSGLERGKRRCRTCHNERQNQKRLSSAKGEKGE